VLFVVTSPLAEVSIPAFGEASVALSSRGRKRSSFRSLHCSLPVKAAWTSLEETEQNIMEQVHVKESFPRLLIWSYLYACVAFVE
jgi:hypothetical protein